MAKGGKAKFVLSLNEAKKQIQDNNYGDKYAMREDGKYMISWELPHLKYTYYMFEKNTNMMFASGGYNWGLMYAYRCYRK